MIKKHKQHKIHKIQRKVFKLLPKKLQKRIISSNNIMESNKEISLENAQQILEKAHPKPNTSTIGNNQIIDIKYNLQIIIPAYNVEKYIYACLESVFKQKTQYKYLVVVIDDGSKDRTGKIIDDYFLEKANDINVVIHQKNSGLSSARNKGLNIIQAEYLMFLDSDDILEQGAIEQLLNSAYKNNADIVEGGIKSFGRIIPINVQHKEMNNVNSFKTLYGYPWGKVYRSLLFSDFIFPEGYWYEDTALNYRVWASAKRISTIEKVVYRYRINMSGITQTSVGNIKSLDSVYITDLAIENLRQTNIELSNELYDFTLRQIIINFERIYELDNVLKINAYIVMREYLNKYFDERRYITQCKALMDIEASLRKKGSYQKFLYAYFRR